MLEGVRATSSCAVLSKSQHHFPLGCVPSPARLGPRIRLRESPHRILTVDPFDRRARPIEPLGNWSLQASMTPVAPSALSRLVQRYYYAMPWCEGRLAQGQPYAGDALLAAMIGRHIYLYIYPDP